MKAEKYNKGLLKYSFNWPYPYAMEEPKKGTSVESWHCSNYPLGVNDTGEYVP